MDFISQYGFYIIILIVIILLWLMILGNSELRQKYFKWHFSARKPWMIIFVVIILIVGYSLFIIDNVSENVQIPITNESSQIVTVRVSISGMNAPVFALVGSTTILGQRYLYVRNADSIVTAIDPGSVSIGDSCGDTVNAEFEISNAIVEDQHRTFKGDTTVSVDVIRVVSSETPKRSCASFE